MENMKEMNPEQLSKAAGGVLTENDKRCIRVLIVRAKAKGIDDVTWFLNTEPWDEMSEEQMNYAISVWDVVN